MIDPNKTKIQSIDSRRDIIIPGDYDETLEFCVDYFIKIANEAIQDKGFFTVALSGGSTPKAIFNLLAKSENSFQIDWNLVHLYWGDERSVPPDNSDNNFYMAMQSGLGSLNIPSENIHRMCAESDIEKHADEYEQLIIDRVPNQRFDLVTLGMGGDGHTASLFPHTKALLEENRLVVANEVPQKNTMRMTLTYRCINQAHNICLFVLGAAKQETLAKVLQSPYQPEVFPSQKIGTESTKALWIVDQDAAARL